MKKIIYYLIIFLGFSALLSELVNNFEEMKLSYATFNSEKYYELEELKDTLSVISGGSSTALNLYVYYGKLANNKVEGRITGLGKEINKIRLKNGNIPVWFCNLKGVSKLKLRIGNTPPSKPFFKVYFYIFCWISSIYSIICLVKLKNEK